MKMVVVLFILLLLYPPYANTPGVRWRLEPTGWQRESLCSEPCVLEHGAVTGYKWVLVDDDR